MTMDRHQAEAFIKYLREHKDDITWAIQYWDDLLRSGCLDHRPDLVYEARGFRRAAVWAASLLADDGGVSSQSDSGGDTTATDEPTIQG